MSRSGRISKARISTFFHSTLLACCLTLGVLIAPANAQNNQNAKAPLAGTRIENQADVTFDLNNQPVHMNSNVVTVIVSPQQALSLTADNTQQTAPAARVALPHRLTNLGNTPGSYTISVNNLGGDSYDLSDLQIFRDINGNGQPDIGEPQLANGATIALNVGEYADLVVIGTVPANVLVGQSAQARITATTTDGTLSANNTDTITTTAGVAVRVLKDASPQQAAAGQNVTFTLTVTSYGSVAPAPIPVTVDGSARDLVVLRDIIPANTQFVSLSDAGNGTRLYHRLGDTFDTYTSTAPDVETIDAVGYGFNSLGAPRNSSQLLLQVKVLSGGVTIRNTGEIEYSNGPNEGKTTTPSNEVLVTTPATPPLLQYFTSGTFTRVATATGIGTPLYLQAQAAACNQDPTKIETETITIRSLLTGDTIQVTATETGANTGFFRVGPLATDGGAANPNDNVLQTRKDDILTATLIDCAGVQATATIQVEPFGVVFDSRTNAPLADATVTLIDVDTGQPATVFQFDGVTSAPSTVVTGADGTFQFPQVAPGVYRLQIVPPTGYKFPSVVPPSLLPINRIIDASGSYGRSYNLAAGGAIQIDVPLDGPPPSGLFIEKNASRSSVDLGEFVNYSVRIRNNSGTYLSLVKLNDLLPHGFALIKNSVRYNNVAVADPLGAPGPNLVFALPDLSIEQEIVVTYRVRVGVNAFRGKNRNRAQWSGVTPVGTSFSNVASASVDVQEGVFTTKGIIFGKVFVDANRNRQQDKGEVGIPGVRVYLEDGTFAITDTEGKYSVYGVSATSHNVKLDKTTMPAGSQLELLTNRNLNQADSVLADLKNAEMHKVDFAESSATDDILDEVTKRRKAGEDFLTETEQGIKTNLNAEASRTPGDTRGLPASGIVGGNNINNNTSSTRSGVSSNDNFASGLGGTRLEGTNGVSLAARGALLSLNDSTTPLRSALSGPVDGLVSPPQITVPMLGTPGANEPHQGEEMEALLQTMTPDLGFVDLKDKDTLPSPQLNVRVKGAFGMTFSLKVNGETITEDRVGTRSSLEAKKVQAWEYIGVRLKAGDNTLEVTQIDPFGNARGTQKISVTAPGSLGKLKLVVPLTALPADGRSLVSLKVLLTDDKDVKVTARTPITLESTNSLWQVVDLNPTEPGVQVFIEGGEANFKLLSPLEAGQVVVRVSSGILESVQRLVFVPELRPLIGSGIGDVRLNLFGFSPKGARSIRTNDVFDDELNKLSGDFNSTKRVDGRAALFLKGRVQGKYLLTLRYDSQNNSDNRLFRDIQPDAFYPVYGDSSIKGFDAQSTSKLYVRIDRNQSYVLYGDYTTTTVDQLETLSRYSRSLNGLQFHHENERSSLTAYQSRDNTRQIVNEMRGRGISGPYSLGNFDIRRQSEKVEILVRDRNQPSVILSSTPQTRFTDYEIDSLSNGLIFRRPVPSIDGDGNPVSIRVTYEVETGGPKFDVYGVKGQFKVSPNLQVGGSYNRTNDPASPSTLMGLSAVARLSPNTVLIGEWAHSDRSGISSTGSDGDLGGRKGSGLRLEMLHSGKKLQARLFAGRTTRGFDNPEANLTRGRSELSANATYQLSPKSRLIAEAIRTEDRTTHQKLTGAQISVDSALSKTVRGQIGLRYSSGNPDAALQVDPTTGVPIGSTTGNNDRTFTSLFARVAVQLPKLPHASLFGRYEQDLSSSKKSFALGGEYQIANRTRLYLVHEFLDSLGGLYALNESQRSYNTRFGIESDYMRNGRVYSEYRIGSGIDGRSAEAAFGLRNAWVLAPGLRLNTNFEQVKSSNRNRTSGDSASGDSSSLAAGIGLEYLAKENLKATARLETRNGQGTRSLLHSFGVAYKPGHDLTLLTRNIYTKTTSNGAPNRVQDRFQIGLAYRQTDIDKLSALLKYEYRLDENADTFGSSLLFPNLRRAVSILSGDLNYQPRPTLDMSLHYAWKKVNDRSGGLQDDSQAQLLSGRITKELNRKYDFSLMASTLWSKNSGRQYGIGAELGYVLDRNLLLSVGYNIAGYKDVDLAGESFTKRGLYLRLRFKFDENLFRGLEGKAPAQADTSIGFTPITAPGVSPALVPGANLFGAAPGQLNQN